MRLIVKKANMFKAIRANQKVQLKKKAKHVIEKQELDCRNQTNEFSYQ